MSFQQQKQSQQCENGSVSAVDRLMRAMSSSDSLPSATSSTSYAAVLDSFTVGKSRSSSSSSYTMDSYLSQTLAGIHELGKHLPGNLQVKLNVDGCSTAMPTDDSPRSMLSVFSPRTDNESLFDEYAQDGPHEESASETQSEPDFDAIDYTKFVCQREKKLFKTEMCLLWIEKGFCEYGSQCKFAHHTDERRTLQRHPKFRTQICRHFAETGACPFGRRCHFRHGNEPQCTPVPQPHPQPQTLPYPHPQVYPQPPHPYPQPHPQPQPPSIPNTPRRLPIFQVLAQE